MMEFYSESSHVARKPHVCEMCCGTIHPGERYYRENGKWEGEFFTRALHEHCHLMEADYCSEVDNEFSWDEIIDYISDIYCRKCPHSPCHDDLPDWTECEYSVTSCPTIKKALREKYGLEGNDS
jgi:hypothetical protein